MCVYHQRSPVLRLHWRVACGHRQQRCWRAVCSRQQPGPAVPDRRHRHCRVPLLFQRSCASGRLHFLQHCGALLWNQHPSYGNAVTEWAVSWSDVQDHVGACVRDLCLRCLPPPYHAPVLRFCHSRTGCVPRQKTVHQSITHWHSYPSPGTCAGTVAPAQAPVPALSRVRGFLPEGGTPLHMHHGKKCDLKT